MPVAWLMVTTLASGGCLITSSTRSGLICLGFTYLSPQQHLQLAHVEQLMAVYRKDHRLHRDFTQHGVPPNPV